MGVAEKPMLILIDGVYKHYTQQKTQIDVLCGVCMQIAAGEMVAIVGPSGAGKSTLLHLMGGLERPSRGTIQYGDVDFQQLSDDQLADFRNHRVGFVFQFHHLLPEFSALENTMMPALIQRRTKREVQQEAHQL